MKKINWKKILQATMVIGSAVYGYYLWVESLKWLAGRKKEDFLKKETSEKAE